MLLSFHKNFKMIDLVFMNPGKENTAGVIIKELMTERGSTYSEV